MSPVVKHKVQNLVDKYFIGQTNSELFIKQDELDNFLKEYSEIILSRLADVVGIKP